MATESNLGSFTPQTGYDLYFGHVQGQSQPLGGMLDEVSLHSRALDGQELWDIYSADKNGKCPVDQNRAPAVNAGPDQLVPQGSTTANLSGSVSDDGLPLNAGVTLLWSKNGWAGQRYLRGRGGSGHHRHLDAPGIYVLR